MKIALVRVHTPVLQLVPPINLATLSAYLEKYGIQTIIIDALKYGMDNPEIAEIALKENVDAVGIGCMTAEYNKVVELSNLIKEKKIKCIIGGIHPTVFPYQTLIDSKADFVICGEGEIALTQLALNNFENNNIKGVYSLSNLKDDKQSVDFAEFVANLDEIPFIWDKIQPKKYQSKPSGQIYKKMPFGYIMASRGCSYNCTFCASSYLYKGKVRIRSVENIIIEMKELINLYGVKEIKFLDDNIAFKKDYILNLCNLIVDNNITIPWACTSGLRAKDVDEEIVLALKKAGCYNFNIGIESGNNEILKKVNKQENIEDFNKAINLAYKHNIVCGAFFVFGLPGETKETMQETINFAKNSKLTIAMFNILEILPGSKLWNDLNYKFDRSNLENSYSQPRYLPNNLTAKDIINAQKQALRNFYFRPKMFFKLLPFIKLSPVMYFFERLFKKVKIKGD
ncbi:MAG: radical SAM protein [Endomicrobiaceae bacterium]|nr:radical SAM protein [Endomicrobiaceae bacterium]